MAVSNKAKVSNLIYLTENGGTQLVRALFLKRMCEMKPHNEDPATWTLDMFLKMNREKIELLKLNRKSLQVLFPTEGKQTNISFWDLSLLIRILKTTCECELSTDIKMKIDALKKLRDKLAHLGDSSITDSKYKDSLDKLHLIFEIVLNELKDEELDNTVREMFKKLDTGEIPDTEISSALESLRLSCEDIKKSEEETRNTVITEHNETRRTIEKGNTELRDLLKKLVDSKDNGYTGPPVIIPAKLNGSTETDEHLTQIMLDMFNKEISNVPELHELLGHQKTMRNAVHMFCTSLREKGYEIVNAENGCILLHVRFAQIISLFSFYLDYISGDLDIYLDELEKASKCYLSFKEFRLEMILYEDDFCQVLYDIENAKQEHQEPQGNLTFGRGYREGQHNDADKNKLYVQDGGSTSVLLTFKPLSHYDGTEFESVFESESRLLIQNFKLPHQASISKRKISEEKEKEITEITSQEDLHSTRESSTMTSFDECRFTTAAADISLRAENDRLKQDLQKAKEEVYKTATFNADSLLRDENDRLRKELDYAKEELRIRRDLEKAQEEFLWPKVAGETRNKRIKQQISDLEKENDASRKETVLEPAIGATAGAETGATIGAIVGRNAFFSGEAIGAFFGRLFRSSQK